MQAPQILMVDDQHETLAIAEALLNQNGYRFVSAQDGQTALEMLKTGEVQPDLALLDIQLPGMSGYELCEHMQEHAEWALIPVVFLTGAFEDESRFQAFQLGAVGFLGKPIDPQALLSQVRRALDVRRQWTEDFSPTEPALPVPVASALPQLSEMESQALRVRPQTALPAPSELKLSPQERLDAIEQFHSPSSQHALVAQTPTPTETPPRPKTKKPQGVQTFAGFVQFVSQHLQIEPDGAWTPDNLYAAAERAGIAQDIMAELVSAYTGLPLLGVLEPEQVRSGILPVPFCRRYHVVPFDDAQEGLSFAIPHPFLIEVEDALHRHSKSPRLIASPHLILDLFDGGSIRQTKSSEPVTASQFNDVMSQLHHQYGVPELPTADLQALSEADAAEAAPMIKLVNQLLEEAYELRASDLHIDPWEDAVMVRYRIDGDLRDMHLLKPAQLIHPLVARIKIMAQLNIAEKRLPQDGRIAFRHFTRKPLDFDLRVSTAPMNFGEKVVMRIIDKQKSTLPLHVLGLSKRNLELYRTLIHTPHGMVLHVGPTGSGKSMTLYAALNEINDASLNIMTAEDPIEYTLPRINQMQVQPAIGLTFARALRAYLRQDPDVILVGEIRDRETAHIAVEAALTGHLLLSTMHTNDAASTLLRFLEMGIEPFMVSPSVVMICAQRLVRKICEACRESYLANRDELAQLGLSEQTKQTLYRGMGCDRCGGSGFHGRTGIHELMVPTEEIRRALSETGMTAERLKRIAVQQGMITLYWDAMDKARQGITTISESLSVVVPDEFDSRPPSWGASS